jgi:hypothetical protein
MAKNMTRKGLALGTASALVIAGFVGTPAVAGGLADKSFVSLAPSTGTAYTVVSGNGKTFSLTANEAASISAAGRNLKFLVTDADSALEPTIATTGRALAIADNSVVNMTAVASSVITISDAAAAAKVAVGDKFYLTETLTVDGFTDSAGGGAALTTAAAANTIFTVSAVVANTSFSFASGTNAVGQTDLAGAINGATEGGKVIREARADNGSFVVDTGSATPNSDEILVLAQGDETTTRTVTVEAWVDNNSNDLIDSTEYASEVRTVVFKKASEITGTVTWTAPTLGDANLVASVTTTPTLNGPQVGNSMVHVVFTRQGIAGNGPDAAAWDSTNGEWDGSLGVQADTSAGVNGIAGTNWGAASAAVIAGTYSARPYILTTAIGDAVAATVGTTQADDVKASIAGTANNDAGDNATSAAATAVTIRKGSSVTVTASIYDATAALVGAGIPVTATLSGVTGTIKVNGSTSSDSELTNASGVVTFTVTTTTSLATDAATLTIQAQNVTDNAKKAAYTLTWDDATTTLHDAQVANPASDVNRSVAKNGTVTFNFKIADQWKQALSGSYRLKVANTGNTVNTSYVTVTGGAATVSVTDGQIAAGSSISTAIDVEKDVSGTWTAQDLTNDGNTDGAADTVTYTTGVLTQTDAVTLDTDADTTYGSATADDSDTIAAKTTVAQDTRSSFTAVPAYANDVVISGRVAHATTAAVRTGAVVTITGTSDMLFTNGGAYSFGSITLVTDSSGEFDVSVYSNKVQKDTVVTVTSNGASATKKVTFVTAGADSGTKVSFTGTPASAAPGATFQVVATLQDAYNNTVDATAGDVKVTYSGPGIVFGTLPNDTDAAGQAKFAVLVGAADSGTATITFAYDTNADGDTSDTGEFSTSQTVSIAVVEPVAKIGSFSGRVAVRVENAKGSDVSVKIGKQWYKFVAKNNNYLQSWKSRKGTSVAVSVYVDGELQNVQTITVK